jgi:hypothetical protein
MLMIAEKDEQQWILRGFEPESSEPVLEQSVASTFIHGLVVIAGDARANRTRPMQIVALNGDNNLVVYERVGASDSEATIATSQKSEDTNGWTNMLSLASSSRNMLSNILPSSGAPASAVPVASTNMSMAPLPRTAATIDTAKACDAMFEAPSHTLSSLHGLFEVFMDSLLCTKSESSEETQQNADAMDMDTAPTRTLSKLDSQQSMAPVVPRQHDWSWLKNFA